MTKVDHLELATKSLRALDEARSILRELIQGDDRSHFSAIDLIKHNTEMASNLDLAFRLQVLLVRSLLAAEMEKQKEGDSDENGSGKTQDSGSSFFE